MTNILFNLASLLNEEGLRKEANQIKAMIKLSHFEPKSNKERKSLNRISRLITKALRHAPEEINISPNRQGWVTISSLLNALEEYGKTITREELNYLVEIDDKQRLAFDETESLIRANQGHSIDVDLGYSERIPPEYLYHGTNREAINIIKKEGISKMGRHHVHLSENLDTATQVGRRRGRLIMLRIEASRMHEDGYIFYLSDNNVWLTDHVPPQYILKD